MLDFILEILSDAFNGRTTLHTSKIDHNIERLRQYDWFEQIYRHDRYRRLFFANRHVRKYLQSDWRVHRIIKKKQARAKFIDFLTKQLKNRPLN
ncbi:hypothetical protein [Lysinibacillus sp. ZYM-1]|uniref:hypothetical protein n=1 Tax=Lysinibacillus sp. ZYM-1 TaxID=1681184 RepID=UPI0006CE84E4|nr:hypothetical protein [Lysinibacillus sp. ZYM-1]KPN96320.1 hypothetical protein AO843_17175 [Lysinibacillus sp. ZYM-1]